MRLRAGLNESTNIAIAGMAIAGCRGAMARRCARRFNSRGGKIKMTPRILILSTALFDARACIAAYRSPCFRLPWRRRKPIEIRIRRGRRVRLRKIRFDIYWDL
jgi:hypothetical protein